MYEVTKLSKYAVCNDIIKKTQLHFLTQVEGLLVNLIDWIMFFFIILISIFTHFTQLLFNTYKSKSALEVILFKGARVLSLQSS